MRTPTWTIVLCSAFAALTLGVALTAYGGGFTREGVLEGVRITARWSFPWFLAAWTASSLARLWPGGWRTALLRRRRAVGLAFAANHFVHLGFVLTVMLVFGVERPLGLILGGGTVYALIAAMALTSNDAAQRAMGMRGWRLLHGVGGWAVLLVFTNSYAGRLMEKPALAIPAVTLIGLALGLRIAASVKARLQPQAA